MNKRDLLDRIWLMMRDRTAHSVYQVDRKLNELYDGEPRRHAVESVCRELGYFIAKKNVSCVREVKRLDRYDIIQLQGDLLVMSPDEVIEMVSKAFDDGRKFDMKRRSNKTGRVRNVRA